MYFLIPHFQSKDEFSYAHTLNGNNRDTLLSVLDRAHTS